MSVYRSAAELIGGTPLLELQNYQRQYGLHAKIFAKLECYNPAGSVKDRVALAMIEAAEAAGALKAGATIIEPTSGNTGIGLAAVGTTRGYKVILTMPETMSLERRKLISAYGAEIVLTDGAKGMQGAIERAEELANEIDGAFLTSQFSNPANPAAHRMGTGVEIWNDLNGNVDVFVAGIGTGGTVTGVGECLKGKNPNIKIIGVEPLSSPVLSGGQAGAHGLQGIGAGFVPENLNLKVIDEVFCVSEEDAYAAARALARSEGVLVGISSGAALVAATEIAKRKENAEKNIVVLLPDSGERYLSTPLFSD